MFAAITGFSGFSTPREIGWIEIVCLVSLAVLPTVVSFMCTTLAIQYIGSTPTAILGSLEPVTALAIGAFVFGEVITDRDILGLILIIIGVTLVVVSPDVPKEILRRAHMWPRLKR